MFSRKVAAIAAMSLLLATSPAVAQTAQPTPPTTEAVPPPPANNPLGRQEAFTQSGLFLMLTAILGAVLLTVLATQIGGDEPASP